MFTQCCCLQVTVAVVTVWSSLLQTELDGLLVMSCWGQSWSTSCCSRSAPHAVLPSSTPWSASQQNSALLMTTVHCVEACGVFLLFPRVVGFVLGAVSGAPPVRLDLSGVCVCRWQPRWPMLLWGCTRCCRRRPAGGRWPGSGTTVGKACSVPPHCESATY